MRDKLRVEERVNSVRLSSTTITPSLAELFHLKGQQHQESESVYSGQGDKNNDLSSDETPPPVHIFQRNNSTHSQDSQALSIQSTDDTSSSSDSRHRPRLAIDEGYISSIPTSPEDEISVSRAGLGEKRKPSLSAFSNGSQKEQEYKCELGQISTRDKISTTSQGTFSISRNSLISNRNKPLPVPIEQIDLLPTSPSTALKTFTTLSTSPKLYQDKSDHSRRVTPRLPSQSLDRNRGFTEQSKTRQSSFTPSTKTASKTSSRPDKGAERTLASSNLLDVVTSSSAISPRRSRSSSTRHDAQNVISSRPVRIHLSPKVYPTSDPSSSSRSASPFFSRRGSSWLGKTKHDYKQERHVEASSSRDISPYASSSSAEQEVKLAKRATTSALTIAPRSSRTEPGKQVSTSTDANGTNSKGNTVEKSYLRPPLLRHRSKSMDVLQRFRSDEAVKTLEDLAGLKGSDSVAVGISSITEVDLPTTPTAGSGNDRSRLSRFLTRKPSKVALEKVAAIGITAEVSPEVPNKDDLRERSREGALSRLTGSLLRRRSSTSMSTSMKASVKTTTSKQGALISHNRKQSLDLQVLVVIPQLGGVRQGSEHTVANGASLKYLSHSSPDSKSQRKSVDLKATNPRPLKVLLKRAPSDKKPSDLQLLLAKAGSKADFQDKKSTLVHSRNQSNDMDDDFFSIASMTPSNSDQASISKLGKGVNSSETSPARSKRASVSRRSSPPSAYREWGRGIKPRMTESDSDSVLLNEIALVPLASKRSTVGQPLLTKIPPARLSYQERSRTISAKVASKPTTGPIEIPFEIMAADSMKKVTESLIQNKTLSISEDVLVRTEKEQWETEELAIGKKDFHKPLLSIDTSITALETPARPKSAMEVIRTAAQLSMPAHPRRPSQATLGITDDLEFLQALEHVRKVNQDRIKKQKEEANRVQQMARMGMASFNRRTKGQEQTRGRQQNGAHSTQSKRSFSAHDQDNRSNHVSLLPILKGDSTTEPPSALELGVGKASGKMQDGAFINDDDWKKEVKALFIIREIVLTERSYSRHLEALLQSVQSLNLSSKKTLSSSSIVPNHITMMRRLLPQLIALSRNLADRIDTNPTAAGVGNAFRLVNGQIEATFIAWSSVATEIMDALRISEKTKSKTKDRIGLITLSPLEHIVISDAAVNKNASEKGQMEGIRTVPSSPNPALIPLFAERGISDVPLAKSPTYALKMEDGQNRYQRGRFRRRSTLSGLTPSLTAALRNKAIVHESEATTPPTLGSTSSFGRRAIEVMVQSKAPLLKTKPRSGSISLPVSQRSSGPPSSCETPNTAIPFSSSAGKSLSAMDVVIMPTQRLLRYLLLLRNLNTNTPPQSLSHIRLQRCLDSLTKVASNCDKVSSLSSSSL